jgi:hypothetical protein
MRIEKESGLQDQLEAAKHFMSATRSNNRTVTSCPTNTRRKLMLTVGILLALASAVKHHATLF